MSNQSGLGHDFENVLLISIDCLRADRFQEGIDEGILPTMKGLQENGTYFSNAHTVANTTDPSLTSFHSAQYPQSHGVRENGWGVDEDVPLLAEELGSSGCETFGVVSVDHLSHEHSGLGRGFDAYRNDDSYDTLYPILSRIFETRTFNLVFGAVKNLGTKRYNFKNLLRDVGLIRLHCRGGQSVNEDALDELRNVDGPFFGWMHYFDMHEPRNFSRSLLSEHDEYTASMITVDGYIETVLDELETLGLREDTLIVLTGDHGENLDDHGYTGHGRTLYDEEIHVPLLFSNPRLEKRAIDAQVRSIDVAPTIMDLLGVPFPDTFQGETLASDDEPVQDRELFLSAYPEFTDAVGIRTDGWKLVRTGDEYELFDLVEDPEESTDRYGEAEWTEKSEELREKLATWEAKYEETEAQSVDEDTKEMLEDLGYVD